MRQRLNPTVRREQIIAAALVLAERSHYSKITRDDVAREAGVSMGLVTHHFGTMQQLRRSLMRAAIAANNATVVAQGLVDRDKHALNAPPELKRAAADIICA